MRTNVSGKVSMKKPASSTRTRRTGTGWEGLSRLLWGHPPKFIPLDGLPNEQLILLIIEPATQAHPGKFDMILPFILGIVRAPGLMGIPCLFDNRFYPIGEKHTLPDSNLLCRHHSFLSFRCSACPERQARDGRDYLRFAHRARTRLTIPSNSSWGISKRSETRSQSQRERCSCPLASRVTTTGASHLMHFPSRTTNIIVFLSTLGGRPHCLFPFGLHPGFACLDDFTVECPVMLNSELVHGCQNFIRQPNRGCHYSTSSTSVLRRKLIRAASSLIGFSCISSWTSMVLPEASIVQIAVGQGLK